MTIQLSLAFAWDAWSMLKIQVVGPQLTHKCFAHQWWAKSGKKDSQSRSPSPLSKGLQVSESLGLRVSVKKDWESGTRSPDSETLKLVVLFLWHIFFQFWSFIENFVCTMKWLTDSSNIIFEWFEDDIFIDQNLVFKVFGGNLVIST